MSELYNVMYSNALIPFKYIQFANISKVVQLKKIMHCQHVACRYQEPVDIISGMSPHVYNAWCILIMLTF